MGFKYYFIFFLEYAFMFMCGSLVGWGLELFYRRFFTENRKTKQWINPGFLNGPCVPLYGFGLCGMYLLANIPLPVSGVGEDALRLLFMAAGMTLIEYIAGVIFIKGMKVKLWDYSKNKGNIQGIICPLFSFFWAVLGALYYFFINPFVKDSIYWFVDNIWFSYFVGIFSGIFITDLVSSLNLLTRIREFAKENEIIIRTEELKNQILAFKEKNKLKSRFMLTMHNFGGLYDRLTEYKERIEKRDR